MARPYLSGTVAGRLPHRALKGRVAACRLVVPSEVSATFKHSFRG